MMAGFIMGAVVFAIGAIFGAALASNKTNKP